MNAEETTQAAINKLVLYRDEAAPAPWLHDGGDFELYGLTNGAVMNLYPYDAELISMLHRTIDAQLAILGNQLTLAKRGHNASLYLTLAKAILGEES